MELLQARNGHITQKNAGPIYKYNTDAPEDWVHNLTHVVERYPKYLLCTEIVGLFTLNRRRIINKSPE